MRLVMMGTGTFAEPTFEALLQSRHEVVGLVTQPDRAVGNQRGSTRQTGKGMKAIALERGMPVLQPDSINTPDGVRSLGDLRPDLLVVAAYGQILSRDVLAVAPRGGINVHASLLPKYRGAAPIAWAIYHGETVSGVTIIRMSIALDAGDMLAQESVAIGPDETAGELEARLGFLGARLAVETIEQLEQGTTQGIVQDKSQVTKAPKLTKELGLIDWSRPAVGVCNQIRAMQPWPSPYTFLRRPNAAPLRLIVFLARPADLSADAPVGGVRLDGSRLLVRAGDGWVEIFELQPAGKRRMSAHDFIRGNPLPLESMLGPESP